MFHKLIEELEEFKATPNEEELADILELIDGIANAFDLDMDKVLKVPIAHPFYNDISNFFKFKLVNNKIEVHFNKCISSQDEKKSVIF
ncbi:hypothetical protein V7014_23245 [Bacillus sp. JJ722]